MATVTITVPDNKKRNIDVILAVAERLGVVYMKPPKHLPEATVLSFPFEDTEDGVRLSKEFFDSIPVEWYS